jgi:flagellin
MQVINTNVASMNAQRNLTGSGLALATALQRLSSGLRINSAKDDAAGLAIAERFSTQIRGSDVAQRNASDGISLSQTAEGSLAEVANNLQRIRELSVQARNGTNSVSDRAALDNEVQQLKAEIDRVSGSAAFNGVKLLDGSFTSSVFQVGANAGETIYVNNLTNASSSALGTYNYATVNGAAATAFTAVTAGDLTINGTSVGAIAATTTAPLRAAQVRDAINNVSGTTGVYATTDTANNIVTLFSQNAITVAHAGASSSAAITGLTAATTAIAAVTGFATGNVLTGSAANSMMFAMDAALTAVNTARATLGAIQNRFQSVVNNLSIQEENLTASRSRILDADFAAETAALTRAQILQQAGTAILAQANAVPQNVLTLLR